MAETQAPAQAKARAVPPPQPDEHETGRGVRLSDVLSSEEIGPLLERSDLRAWVMVAANFGLIALLTLFVVVELILRVAVSVSTDYLTSRDDLIGIIYLSENGHFTCENMT